MFVVLLTAFGFPILASVASAAGGRYAGVYTLDNVGVGGLIAYEVAALLVVCTFLKGRGWSLRDIHPEVSWRLTGAGVVLYLLILLASWILFFAFAGLGMVDPEPQRFADAGKLGLAMLAVLCVVNPIFEESLVVGYVTEALRGRRSPLTAVNVSVSVRLLYHLYQGPIGVITVVPAGLLFSLAYLRLNRIWPLVVAHGILDALGIMNCR